MKKQVILSLTPVGHDTAAALMINGEDLKLPKNYFLVEGIS